MNPNYSLFSSEMSNNNFMPMTTTMQYNMNLSNYNKAFEQNKPIIGKVDYTNNNLLLYNNVNDNLLDEQIVEYRLHIDSTDRDIKYYPDPFSFTVKLNPPGSSTTYNEETFLTKIKKIKKTKIVETRFEGPPAPHINKEFKNVKYVKLENIILPQFSKIKEKNKKDKYDDCKLNDTYEFDHRYHLITDRYVSLTIKELEPEKTYSTSQNVTRLDDNCNPYTPKIPFAFILPDKILGTSYYTGNTCYGNKIFKHNMLGNLTQLTIQFYDSMGIPLKYNDLMTLDDLEQYEFDNGQEFPITDLRHPLNKKIQLCFTIVIGVVEPQINTNIQY